jgi:hypothetical protein
VKEAKNVLLYDKNKKFKIVSIYERQLSKGVCYYYQVIKEYINYTDEVWVIASNCYVDKNKETCCEQEAGDTCISLAKENDEIYIPSKLFQVKDYHAMICQCKKCIGIWDDILDTMSDDVKIINSNPKAAGEVLTKDELKGRLKEKRNN